MSVLGKAIEEVLYIDSILQAEKITRKRSDTDKETLALGFLLFQQNERDKNSLLELSGDVTRQTKLDQYLEISNSIGFKFIKEFYFHVHGRKEKQIFLYKHGCLLVLDTYENKKVNSAYIYHNWLPNNGFQAFCKSKIKIPLHSGCWNKNFIWIGDTHVGEALKYKVSILEEHGSFICPWVERPFSSLCHYGDYDCVLKNGSTTIEGLEKASLLAEERIIELPEEIQQLIPPKSQRF